MGRFWTDTAENGMPTPRGQHRDSRRIMEILTQNFKRDGNTKVHSVYAGVSPGGRTVTTIVKPSADQNHMEATKVYGSGLGRGQGGRIAVLVLGGMETTLDEMEYIVAAKQDKKFIPRRNGGEI